MDFDVTRAMLKGANLFHPFRVNGKGVPLRDLKMKEDAQVIVFERQGVFQALPLNLMAYHHIAQGEVEGEPYLVSF